MFRDWSDSPGAPSWAGYGVQLVATFTIFAVLGPLGFALQTGDAGDLLAALLWSPLYVLYGLYVGGVPFLIGVLLVHAGLRTVSDQRVHVLAFGLVGAVLPLLAALVVLLLQGDLSLSARGLVELSPAIGAAGVSAALGRRIVYPLVPAVQQRRAEARAGRPW